jgi:hypothetical protein
MPRHAITDKTVNTLAWTVSLLTNPAHSPSLAYWCWRRKRVGVRYLQLARAALVAVKIECPATRALRRACRRSSYTPRCERTAR